MELVETGSSPAFACLSDLGSEDSFPDSSVRTAVADRSTAFPSPVKLTSVEDVALAVRAYEKAVERKAGQALPDLTG